MSILPAKSPYFGNTKPGSGSGLAPAHPPEAVLASLESVKLLVIQTQPDNQSRGNATYLDNDLFITTSHRSGPPNPTDEWLIGQFSEEQAAYLVNTTVPVLDDPSVDLLLLRRNPESPNYSASKPATLAKTLPQYPDEPVYVTGLHAVLGGPHAYPSQWHGDVGVSSSTEYGKGASYFRILTPALASVDPRSISGSPVVNQEGEMLGIVSKAELTQGQYVGFLEVLDLNTLKAFLARALAALQPTGDAE